MKPMKAAGKPKDMPMIAYGERWQADVKISRAVSALQLRAGQYLVHISDTVSGPFNGGLPAPPMPPHTMTVIVDADSVDELRAMFFEKEGGETTARDPGAQERT